MAYLTPQEIDSAPVGTVIVNDKGVSKLNVKRVSADLWEVTGVWLDGRTTTIRHSRVVPKEGESNWLPAPDDFEAWAEERAREYDELAADRFACGGWRCAGAHNEL